MPAARELVRGWTDVQFQMSRGFECELRSGSGSGEAQVAVGEGLKAGDFYAGRGKEAA